MNYYPREVSNETGAQATRRAIITVMRWGREYTGGDIERDTGIPAKTVTQNMHRLIKMGLVERTGKKKEIAFYALVPKKPK